MTFVAGLRFELCVFVVFVVLSSALSVCQLWLGSSFSRSDLGLRMIFAAGLCFELCVFVVFVVLSSALSARA